MWLQQESKARVIAQCVALGAAAVSALTVAVGFLVMVHDVQQMLKRGEAALQYVSTQLPH
jgi:hypothetical protein